MDNDDLVSSPNGFVPPSSALQDGSTSSSHPNLEIEN